MDMLLQQKIEVQSDVKTCFVIYLHRVLYYSTMNRTEVNSWRFREVSIVLNFIFIW